MNPVQEYASSLMTAEIPEGNLSKEEWIGIDSLSKGKNIIVLPSDEGRACCVLDHTDYEAKVNNLLNDTDTYKPLSKDPTDKYKCELSVILNELKAEGAID